MELVRLISNSTRGCLTEFIVANALRLTEESSSTVNIKSS